MKTSLNLSLKAQYPGITEKDLTRLKSALFLRCEAGARGVRSQVNTCNSVVAEMKAKYQ